MPRSVLEADTASSKSWALAGSTVKVGSSAGRGGRQPRSCAAAAASAASPSIRRPKPSRTSRSSSIASITSAATSGSPSSRITRARPRPCPARPAPSDPGWRAPSAGRARCGRRARRAARRPGTGRAWRRGRRAARVGTCRPRVRAAEPSTWSACCRPSSGLVLGLSFAFTWGEIPVPLIEVPLRVRYSPTVRSSAPPLLSGITSWKVPLPNERRSDHGCDPGLLQCRGDDLRRRGGVPVDQHDHRMAGQRIAGRVERPGALGASVGRDDRRRRGRRCSRPGSPR